MLYVWRDVSRLSRISSVNCFYFSFIVTRKVVNNEEVCGFFSPNLIAFQQRVQARDNWIPLLNSYISPNRIRLKKSTSLNCKISANVSKQNGKGFLLFYELIRVSYQWHYFNNQATLLRELTCQKTVTAIKALCISKSNKNNNMKGICTEAHLIRTSQKCYDSEGKF